MIIHIARRELQAYFATSIAYIFVVVFLLISGISTMMVFQWYESNQASLSAFFSFHPWLYLFLVPAVSMRLWSEEYKQGSIELLLTQPITVAQAVLGKFFAAWIFVVIALSLTFPLWITVNYLGQPDNEVILLSYIGSALMASSYLAIGSCISAASANQIVAFVVTLIACLIFSLLGFDLFLGFFQGWLPLGLVDAMASVGFATHYLAITEGVLDVRDMLYFAIMTSGWLIATMIVIDLKRS